jgi:hypothetical protein
MQSHVIRKEEDKEITLETHRTLNEYLKQNPFPRVLQFSPNDNDEQKEGVPEAIQTLSLHLSHAEKGTSLTLKNAFKFQESADVFVSALKKTKHHTPPDDFKLIIQDQLKDESAPTFLYKSLINALKKGESKEWPEGLTIRSHEQPDLIKALTSAMKEGHLPNAFNFFPASLNLSIESRKAVLDLLNALESPKRPEKIGIGFGRRVYSYDSHRHGRRIECLYEVLTNTKIKYGLRLDISDQYFSASATSQHVSLFYDNTSVMSYHFSYSAKKIIDHPQKAEKEIKAIVDDFYQVLRINDTLTDISISLDFRDPRMPEFGLVENMSYDFEKAKGAIVPLLQKNKAARDNKEFILLLPFLNKWLLLDLSMIVLDYLVGEPRNMGKELTDALKQDELFIAEKIIKRNPSLLDRHVQEIKEYVSNKKAAPEYNPLKIAKTLDVLQDDGVHFVKLVPTEGELCDLLEKHIQEWELSKSTQARVSQGGMYKQPKLLPSDSKPVEGKALRL